MMSSAHGWHMDMVCPEQAYCRHIAFCRLQHNSILAPSRGLRSIVRRLEPSLECAQPVRRHLLYREAEQSAPDSGLLHADSKLPQADAMFFQRRELCFTLDGDIFVRYQSFKVYLRNVPLMRRSCVVMMIELPPLATVAPEMGSSVYSPSIGMRMEHCGVPSFLRRHTWTFAGQGGAPEGHGEQGASQDRHWAHLQCGPTAQEGLHR